MEKMTLIELAGRLKVDVPDFVNNYSNKFDDITADNIDDIESVIEYKYFEDDITEHADSNVPVYYGDIDKQYENCEYTVDDVIEEGLMEPMESEADISKAKQIALFMEIEQTTHEEFEEFKDEMSRAIDSKNASLMFEEN